MSKSILVANWKNSPSSLTEAKTLVKGLSAKKILYKKTHLFVAPPLPYFDLVSEKIKSYAHLASQDIPLATKTTTGAVTPDILKSFGVKLAIIGHSERRALGETSLDVSQKIKIALRAGITPLVCVGEPSRDEDGDYFEFLREEIESSLAGLNRKNLTISGIAIAYEPIWAIGKDAESAIEPADLSETIIFIKKVLSSMFGRSVAEKVPILYGGSVEPTNAISLLHETGIRGFLVGHASLDAKSFYKIAEALISK
jgi:triosephosphate isomerase (TIM)